ncbi:hypothetical protein GL218_08399 [Daldinia childiae]|uniref:uncharacterized protein n=1 Tax=Daldinia childiae TaxID=326645 RepID=UPI0014484A3F|nr:uncharacterized protein GL218_08399 [Daldinia childiae]KAF3068390.1 hypothetical protein GL218_08399 [Daldinia childiae]
MDLSNTAAMQIPLYIAPPNLISHSRSGAKYRAYSEDDMARAEQAIAEEGLSLRQASIRFNVPKTTLAERLGDKRPRPPPRKSDEENKQRTRYQWAETDMASAIEAVQNGDKIGEAARRFGVPPSHLNARTRGRAPKNLRSELSRLTLRQEGLLADWATAQSALGCPPTKNELFGLAERVLEKQGSDKKLGKQWIVHWMRRYPQIEILEWEAKELKPKRGQRTDSAVAFSVDPFEPVIDLDELCYGAPGNT